MPSWLSEWALGWSEFFVPWLFIPAQSRWAFPVHSGLLALFPQEKSYNVYNKFLNDQACPIKIAAAVSLVPFRVFIVVK